MKLLLPTYNFADGPKKIIKSIQPGIDLIIVDNSPTDVIKSLVAGNKSITYHKNLKELGPVKNMNYGLNILKSEFISIIHDDEFIGNNELKILNDLSFKNDEIYLLNFIVIKKKKINENIRNTLRKFFIEKFPKLILFINFIGPTASVIFYNDNQIKFDENVKFMFDVDFYYQLFINRKIKFIDIGVESHHKENTVTSRTKFKKLVELKDLIYFKKKYSIGLLKFIFYVLFSYICRAIIKFRVI